MPVLTLPWPPTGLWQNRRVHHMQRARLVKSARRHAWAVAMEADLHLMPDPKARLVFAFHPPDRRRRDIHNMPATMKAYVDGIADAMRVDDQHFRCAFPETFAEPVKGGSVIVTVETNHD